MRASMLAITAALFVVQVTRVALAATPKNSTATEGAATGSRLGRRGCARLAAALLSALLVCLLSGPVLAHDNQYEVDANHNGHVEVYRSGNFHGDWQAYREKANKQLRHHTNEPTIEMVSGKAKAELWVHKTATETDCFGRAAVYTGSKLDEIRLSEECPRGHKMRTLISHEMGHVYGLPAGEVGVASPERAHHRCTSYWQHRSVNVGETPGDDRKGCPVLMVGFGSHDLKALARPG